MPYPAKITPDIIEQVLSRIAQGETLADLSKEFDFHPTSWNDRLKKDEDLAIAYRRAREIGADVIADDVLRIIDAEPARVLEVGEDGKQTGTSRFDSAAVTWAKNRAEMRLKLLAKWYPTKYGDKSALELANKEGETLKVEATPSPETVALTLKLTKALRANGDDQ